MSSDSLDASRGIVVAMLIGVALWTLAVVVALGVVALCVALRLPLLTLVGVS